MSIIPSHLDWKQIDQKPLGSGGQGTVYRVIDIFDPKETVRALKVLDPNASQQARERFQNEIVTVSNISHRSIIKIIDYSQPHDDFQYLVMEYHDGAVTINELCLPPLLYNPFHGNTIKCLDLFGQIISAVRACERAPNPVYHRDISPKNILVLPNSTIRLIDFGLCHTDGDNTITMTGENIGTRSYAPPECGAGINLPVGTHTDIYIPLPKYFGLQ